VSDSQTGRQIQHQQSQQRIKTSARHLSLRIQKHCEHKQNESRSSKEARCVRAVFVLVARSIARLPPGSLIQHLRVVGEAEELFIGEYEKPTPKATQILVKVN
jgi:hypothetical protein